MMFGFAVTAWQRLKIQTGRLILGGLTLVAGALGIWWYAAMEDRVCLVVDGHVTAAATRAGCVGDLLTAAGVRLGGEDVVTPDVKARIKEGMTIRVERAFPVELIVGGRSQGIETVSCTVDNLLCRHGIALGVHDRVEPQLGQEIKPNQTVRVIRVATKELTYQEEVPPETFERKDPGLDKGRRRVVREGRPGLVRRTALVRYEDGRERGREVTSTVWLRRPTNTIVAVGTRPIIYSFVNSRGQVVRYTRRMEMTATAYYWGPECCGPNAQGITKTGARATYGVIAVDPRVIPLGTRLYVEGYGFATALDTGSAIKGNKIDLCFDTYREALMYGKQRVAVYILAQ